MTIEYPEISILHQIFNLLNSQSSLNGDVMKNSCQKLGLALRSFHNLENFKKQDITLDIIDFIRNDCEKYLIYQDDFTNSLRSEIINNLNEATKLIVR